MKNVVLAALAAVFISALVGGISGNSAFERATAHSGGTDKCGCHRNSRTGEYHCHTRKKRGGDCPPQNAEPNRPEGSEDDGSGQIA